MGIYVDPVGRVDLRASTPEEQRAVYTAALQKERARYVARGDKERVAGVDAELRRLGENPARAA